jgi:hypothetical protein
MTLFCHVEIRSDRVDITLSRCRLTELLAGSLDLKMQQQAPTSALWNKVSLSRNNKSTGGFAHVP